MKGFMAVKQSLGSVKRFGVRYGRTTKFKRAQVESLYYGRKLKCPYCMKTAVKRVFAGVWECRSCAAKFTAKAYTIEEKLPVFEEPVGNEQPALVAAEEGEKA